MAPGRQARRARATRRATVLAHRRPPRPEGPDPRPPGDAARHLHADRVALRPAPERRRSRARHRPARADYRPAARPSASRPDELAVVRLAPAKASAGRRRMGAGAPLVLAWLT